ncbi:MAG: hypothetical protein ACR2OU_15715 [Thermomicrobiales bacterium]
MIDHIPAFSTYVNSTEMTITRRRLLALSGALAAAAGASVIPFSKALGQASPAASPAATPIPVSVTPTKDGYTYPEVTWTVTNDAITISEPVTAGTNRVLLANEGTVDQHFFTMLLPAGTDFDAFMKEMDDPNAAMPTWATTTLIAGNPDWTLSGKVNEAFISYDPGQYVVIDPFSPRFAHFTVEGTVPADQVAPKSDIEVGMIEMDFTGLEKPVPAGRHLWKLSNNGTTFHEVFFLGVPAGATKDEILDVIKNPPDGALPPEGYSDNAAGGGSGIISKGHVGWYYLDLAPGSYAAVCFAPMNFEGPPHAFMGMIRPFTVE